MFEHITKDFIRQHKFQGDGLNFPYVKDSADYRLSSSASLPPTAAESRIKLRQELTSLVLGKFPRPAMMESACAVSYELVKKYLNGSRRVTRDALAKLCVGMHLSVEEAQPLFQLEGHSLEPEINLLDALVVDALNCKDDIDVFAEGCEKYGLNLFKNPR